MVLYFISYSLIFDTRSSFRNSKLSSSVANVEIPVRSLAELYIAKEFLIRFDLYIEMLHITGDTIKCNTKKNPFQDLIIFFHDKHSKTFDIKSGNFPKGEYFKGEIRQLTLDNGEIIWYPNKAINLQQQHYTELINRLKSNTFLREARAHMSEEQFNHLESLISKPQLKLHENNSYIDIEDLLMQIQVMSTFHKAFNFVNIYNIPSKILIPSEIHFLEEISKDINPHILNNPRNMQQFMLKALRIYRATNDPHVFKTMKPLRESQVWLSTELDKIGMDIFTV